MLKYQLVLAFVAGVVLAQDYDYEPASRPAPARVQPSYSGPSAPKPTPVAILKQINRHNEDGSYTYGYEGADGAFKIETKLPTGEVKGKYGYVDDTGKVRVVEYGATKYGFEPSGEGITVAPPTLVDETTNKNGNLLPEYSGSYYQEPQQQQHQQQQFSRPAAPRPRPPPPPRQQPSFDSFSGPQQFSPAPQPQRSPSPVPPRPVIPGAAPASTTHNFEFGPPQSSRSFAPAPAPRSRPAPVSFARPAPIEEDYDDSEPAPAPIRSAPRITYAQPAPRQQYDPIPAPAPRPAPQYAPRPSPAGGRSGGGGILDQLSKDYALPQGGAAPLHDISFGYY